MFQLIHLRFTAPRADATAFAAVKAQALGMLANQNASPDVVFNLAVDAAVSGDHPRRQPETLDTVAKWDLARSLAFYKARFADASSFTFFFVGTFTIEQIKPLVETYIASLPATRARETWRDVGMAPPAGIVQKIVQQGIAPRSEVTIAFTGPFDYSPGNRLALRTAVLLLQSRLSDAIREDLAATYAISAEAQTARNPKPEYLVTINWTCDPARVESTVQRVFEEVAEMRATPITSDQAGRIRDFLLRDLERDSQDNGYLLRQLALRYENGEPTARGVVNEETAEIMNLSGAEVVAAARQYLDPARYIKVTLMPEATR